MHFVRLMNVPYYTAYSRVSTNVLYLSVGFYDGLHWWDDNLGKR
jgi:hypothetical protein